MTLPATGRAIPTFLPKTGLALFPFEQYVQHTTPAAVPPPRYQPLTGAAPLPGKGVVNGLNSFLFPKPEEGKPVLPPNIPPEATASFLTALRLSLGPARFYKLLKTLGVIAVGGTVPEALVGLGVTETVQPAKELADTIKGLFLPHHPVQTNANLFTDTSRDHFARLANAVDQELSLYLEGRNSQGDVVTVGFQRGHDVTRGLLELLTGEDIDRLPGRPRFAGVGSLADVVGKSSQLFADEMAAAGVGTGTAALKPLPGEKGDP